MLGPVFDTMAVTTKLAPAASAGGSAVAVTERSASGATGIVADTESFTVL